jgi:hypothetical protein
MKKSENQRKKRQARELSKRIFMRAATKLGWWVAYPTPKMKTSGKKKEPVW